MILLQIIHVETLTVYPILVAKEYEKLATTIHKGNTKSNTIDLGTREEIFNLLGGLRGFGINPELGEVLDDDQLHELDLEAIFWYFYC